MGYKDRQLNLCEITEMHTPNVLWSFSNIYHDPILVNKYHCDKCRKIFVILTQENKPKACDWCEGKGWYAKRGFTPSYYEITCNECRGEGVIRND